MGFSDWADIIPTSIPNDEFLDTRNCRLIGFVPWITRQEIFQHHQITRNTNTTKHPIIAYTRAHSHHIRLIHSATRHVFCTRVYPHHIVFLFDYNKFCLSYLISSSFAASASSSWLSLCRYQTPSEKLNSFCWSRRLILFVFFRFETKFWLLVSWFTGNLILCCNLSRMIIVAGIWLFYVCNWFVMSLLLCKILAFVWIFVF